jgi:hypothetical protein
VVGAPGGLPAEALGGPPSRCALRWTAFAREESEGWAHFEFTRINIAPTILRKKIEDVREAGATLLDAAAPRELYDQMLKLHPLRMNVNALWTSALAIKA